MTNHPRFVHKAMASASQIAQDITQLVERLAVGIIRSVQENLEASTPVDTTWARSNWMPSIGSPFLRGLSALDRSPTAQAASVQAQFQDSAKTSLASYRLSSGPLFVSNNVPYINDLNDGKSPQAPAFFVQRAIAKAVREDIRGIRL